jgi:hypothetical protein
MQHPTALLCSQHHIISSGSAETGTGLKNYGEGAASRMANGATKHLFEFATNMLILPKSFMRRFLPRIAELY